MQTERLQYLQKGWTKLFEMTECERDKQNANWENLDINNLQSNLLKQRWDHFLTYRAPFHSMLGTSFKLIGRHFMACWAPFYGMSKQKNVVEKTCNFVWLDIDSNLQTNDSKWLDGSRDSTLTWLDRVMTLTLTRKNFGWLWLEGLVTLTRQKWLGHITGRNPQRHHPAACDGEKPWWIFPAKERDPGNKKGNNNNKLEQQ